jgi:hypothetical protein
VLWLGVLPVEITSRESQGSLAAMAMVEYQADEPLEKGRVIQERIQMSGVLQASSVMKQRLTAETLPVAGGPLIAGAWALGFAQVSFAQRAPAVSALSVCAVI